VTEETYIYSRQSTYIYMN